MVSKRIATKCPACHNSTLVIGGGNWLVCSLIGCPDPTRINSVGDRADSHFDDLQALRDQRDRLRAALQAFCDEVEMDAAVMAYKCDLGAGEWEAFIDRTKLYKQYLAGKAALTPAGGGQDEHK